MGAAAQPLPVLGDELSYGWNEFPRNLDNSLTLVLEHSFILCDGLLVIDDVFEGNLKEERRSTAGMNYDLDKRVVLGSDKLTPRDVEIEAAKGGLDSAGVPPGRE